MTFTKQMDFPYFRANLEQKQKWRYFEGECKQNVNCKRKI